MLKITLPEILVQIFKYTKDDYNTLYSCILVNKRWCYANIPTLWRDPFYSANSIKILINCLLAEDKKFLTNSNIELKNFGLLEKLPLYNYAKFTTDLSFWNINNKLEDLIGNYNHTMIDLLKKKLTNFILDYSTNIRVLNTSCNNEWPINHPRFSICFQNLYELECSGFHNSKLLDKLARSCKNIQVLNLHHLELSDSKDNYNLAQLIKAQNQIKKLYFRKFKNTTPSSAEIRRALLTHSESIIEYSSLGKNELDPLLVPTLKSLKYLELFSYSSIHSEYLKSISLQNIEVVVMCGTIYNESFLLNLSEFIKINGNNLITIYIAASIASNVDCLGELLNSIAQKCHNLEDFKIIHHNELDQQLIEILNNCKKLKCIRFGEINGVIDGDKILEILNQALPTNLNTIVFENEVKFSNENNNILLDILIDNWRGPNPFKIELLKDNESSSISTQIKKYQNQGFLY